MRILLILSFAVVVLLAIVSPVAAEPQTLQQAWILAYQNNPSLEAERAKLRATDEQVSQALSHWRPSVDGTANVGKTYQTDPALQQFGTANFSDTTRGYGVQVTQPVFRGFRTLSETEAAEKQVMSERAQMQDAEQKLLLDTATAFLDAMRDETIVAIDKDNENVLNEKLEETYVRAKIGDLTQTDVEQAQSRVARAQLGRLKTQNTLTQDRATFARLVGDTPGSLQQPELVLDQPKELDDALHRAMTQNPAVVSAQYALDAADAEIDLNKGSLLPEIDIVGSSSRNWGESNTLPGRFDSSQILLQFTMPLYRSGADYSKVRAAQQTSTQRRMELEEARHQAVELAHNAWQGLETAKAAIKADAIEIEAATKALEGVKVENQIGTRTMLDVLNAEQELLDAKTELARSQHDKNLAVLQIKSAIGELTAEALKLPLTPYDPEHHYETARGAWAGFDEADDDIYGVANKPAPN